MEMSDIDEAVNGLAELYHEVATMTSALVAAGLTRDSKAEPRVADWMQLQGMIRATELARRRIFRGKPADYHVLLGEGGLSKLGIPQEEIEFYAGLELRLDEIGDGPLDLRDHSVTTLPADHPLTTAPNGD